MFNVTVSVEEKRQRFVKSLASGRLQRFAGAFSPLVAMLIEDVGFDGVYVSGAVLSADLGLPDIGLTTLTEVAGRGHQIARATNLPAFIDADTGFGEPMNAARTVRTLEDLGLAGCHIEDQVNPKRCGHLDNKEVVPTGDIECVASRPQRGPGVTRISLSAPAPTPAQSKVSTQRSRGQGPTSMLAPR